MKDYMAKSILMAGAVLVCLMMGLTPTAQAADVSLGAGLGVAPDYEGSEDYEVVPIPYVDVKWDNHMSINWLGNTAKVNLIPFNRFAGTQFQCSSLEAIDRFHDRLNRRGVLATVRRTRGDDIAAACGQLAGQVVDRTRVRLGAKMARARSNQ